MKGRELTYACDDEKVQNNIGGGKQILTGVSQYRGATAIKSDRFEEGGIYREDGRCPLTPMDGRKATVAGYVRDRLGGRINVKSKARLGE